MRSFLLAAGLVGLAAQAVGQEVGGTTSPTPTVGRQTINVIVINFDPVLKTRGGKKLHEAMRWNDPWKLTEKMVQGARAASYGYVDYKIVEKIDYDWNNDREVQTFCEDWLSYPHLPRQKLLLNAKSGGWGPGGAEHHLWWMKHLPHAGGVTDGFFNNWWEYIVNYDAAVRQFPPPGATFEKAKVAR